MLKKYKVVFVTLAAIIAVLGIGYFYLLAVTMRTFSNFCHERIEVRVWVDANGNGRWDAEDPPLPLGDLVSDEIPGDVSLTKRVAGSDGIIPVSLSSPYRDLLAPVPSPTCRHLNQVTIRPIAPAGYTPLSNDAQTLTDGLAFGFQPDSSTAVPSFPPALTCQPITLKNGDTIEKILPLTGRTLVLGINRPPSDTFLLEHLTQTGETRRWAADELYNEDQQIIDIRQGADGVVWVLANPQLISQLTVEDSTWRSTLFFSPFLTVSKIATDSAGRLWVLSADGIARWDAANQDWIYFASEILDDFTEVNAQGTKITLVNSFEIMPSGALLIGNSAKLMLGRLDESTNEIEWQTVDRDADPLPRPDLFVLDDDNRIWFNQMAVFFDTESGEWVDTQFQSRLASFEPSYGIGIGGQITDDSLWVSASDDVLFFVEHYDQADWAQWPLYRIDFAPREIVLDSTNALWVGGHNGLDRCLPES